jgi:hypothetical protein
MHDRRLAVPIVGLSDTRLTDTRLTAGLPVEKMRLCVPSRSDPDRREAMRAVTTDRWPTEVWLQARLQSRLAVHAVGVSQASYAGSLAPGNWHRLPLKQADNRARISCREHPRSTCHLRPKW